MFMMFIRKSKYEDLKTNLVIARNNAQHYKSLYKNYEALYMKEDDKNKILDANNAKLKNQIEELQSRIDILYQYYRLDDEPTQEERTRMRIDMRVHELEMENLRLKSIADSYAASLERDLAFARSNANMLYNMNQNLCTVGFGAPYIIC